MKGKKEPKAMASQRFKNVRSLIEKNALIGSALYVIGGIALAFIAFYAMTFALHTSEPIVTVMSYSMVPNLNRGDMVVLRGLERENIKDAFTLCNGNTTDISCRLNATIVVYWSPQLQKLIIHRVWELNDDGTLTTWGDAVPAHDPVPVQWDWVKGEAILRIPYLGWPRIFLGALIGK